MTQDDLSLEFKRYHARLDEIETETAPRWLMVTVWSAVLVLAFLTWTAVILSIWAFLPMDWRVWP